MNVRSLGFRVTAWYAGLLAVSFLLFGITVFFGLKSYLHWALRNQLHADAVAIAENFLNNYQDDATLATQINTDFAPDVNACFIRITNAQGRVIYISKPPLDGRFVPASIPKLSPSAVPPSLFHVDRKSGKAALYILVFPFRTRDHQDYLVEVGVDHNPIHETLHALLIIFSIGMPAIVVIASIGGKYVLRAALRPVREITSKAEDVSLVHPEVRLPVMHTDDELEQLSRALNRMLERLEGAFKEINRFSGDVSHELRTPLTILRGELEGIARQPNCSPEILDTVGSSLEEVERLTLIVDQLLALSRIDAESVAQKSSLNLSTLVKSTTEQMRLLVEEKKLTVNYDLTPGIMVDGDRSRMKQVVVNLVDNAIKYSHPGGSIDITVGVAGESAFMEIANQGEGIPASALPHVFDRFFRADKARSRETGGTGLGLAIVKAVITAHGGKIGIESTEQIGTCVRCELPLQMTPMTVPEFPRVE